MGKECQVNEYVSSDQVSRNLASSVRDSKTSKQNSRDADVSTLSSERVHSANRTFIRSDLSSGIGETLNEKRKNPSARTTEDISQGDSTTMVPPYPHKQFKADSSQLSSVDSVDPKPAHSLSNHGYSHATQSVDSKKVFDLNEGMEANEENWHSKSINGSNYSSSDILSEPIPVVAKVGIPMGLPEKPLQFGGELGWKRSGIPSAFHSTPLKYPVIKKAPVSRGFDLNIAPTMEPESPVDEASAYVTPKVPEKFHHNRPGTLGIDLNHNPMIEESCKSIYPQCETQQLLPNFDTAGSVTCSGGSPTPNVSNFIRPPYWVDLSSVRGYGHFQGQPLLLGGPTTGQVQMVVPVQMPYTPPGLYIGKTNNVEPTFYPPGVLSPFHNQPGAPAVLAAYPGNARLLGTPQVLNPHAFGNMRQMIFSDGSMPLMENGSRVGTSPETLIPLRMKPVEQIMDTTSSLKRQEPDTGWGSSQMNSRHMASWN